MIATIINCITVCIGSLIGLFFHAKVSSRLREVVFISSGMISLVIGFDMAFQSNSYLIVLFSIGIGGVLGYLLNIEGAILRLGDYFETLTKKNTGEFAEQSAGGNPSERTSRNFALGFLNASILFCAGAMTVVGSIKAGANGDYELLLIKSAMDGFMAIMFTAAYGIGVMFSIVTILVYQGAFTLAGAWLAPLLGAAGLAELSAVGGIMVIMIGMNLLELKAVKTANFLPALIIVPILSSLVPYFQKLFSLVAN